MSIKNQNENAHLPAIGQERILGYFVEIGRLLQETQATGTQGSSFGLGEAFSLISEMARKAHNSENKLMFVGNGGSAAIASHMAIDYSKNGGLRSLSFNDPAALTCLSNDLGYENVFAKQIELHARPGDLLMAISSSGKSENIIRAVEQARIRGCYVVTFTGFAPQNPLRRLGDLNLYIRSSEYGYVEISHLSLCHAILDLASSA